MVLVFVLVSVQAGLGGVFLQTGKTQSFVVVVVGGSSSSGHGFGSVGRKEHEQNSRLAPVGPRGGSAEVHTGRDSCFSPDVGLGHPMGGGHTGRPPPVQIFPSRRALLSQFMHSGTGSRITPVRFIHPHALPMMRFVD